MVGDQNNKVMAAEEMANMTGMPGLAMKMAEASENMGVLSNPLFFSGFNNYRYQQTLIKGGFKDSKVRGIRPNSRRAGLRTFRSRRTSSY